MEITVLPKDLKIGESKDLQLFNYRRTQDIQKTKINLSKNTISFLRTGTKEDQSNKKEKSRTLIYQNSGFFTMPSEKITPAESH